MSAGDLFTPARASPARAPRPPASAPGDDPRLHRCAVCGACASFGIGVSVLNDRPGTWFCGTHRERAGR